MHKKLLNITGMLALTILFSAIAGCAASHESTMSRKSSAKDTTLSRSQKMLQPAIDKTEVRTGQEATYYPSGVSYIDLVVGDGRSPLKSDTIVAHYVGWLTDGTKFESSHDRGRPGTFGVSDVVAGCTEGLLTMKVGGKRIIFIPSHLAYGSKGRPGLIPPDSPLIFEFELLEIK